MNVCDNLGDHLVGNVYVKVSQRHSQLLCVHFIAEAIPTIPHEHMKLVLFTLSED